MDGQEGWGGGGASHKISWRLQHLFSRAERKHACLHIYLQYEIKTYRPIHVPAMEGQEGGGGRIDDPI